MKLEGEFREAVADRLRTQIEAAGDNSVVALLGVASLYGFLRVSEVIRSVEQAIRGRLVVFFPGTKNESNYRLPRCPRRLELPGPGDHAARWRIGVVKIYEVLDRDPRTARLANNGQARIADVADGAALEELRAELETFVCDGQFGDALQRILDRYLVNLGTPKQDSAWVSGFFGSGKSHLLKMLTHLWVEVVPLFRTTG